MLLPRPPKKPRDERLLTAIRKTGGSESAGQPRLGHRWPAHVAAAALDLVALAGASSDPGSPSTVADILPLLQLCLIFLIQPDKIALESLRGVAVTRVLPHELMGRRADIRRVDYRGLPGQFTQRAILCGQAGGVLGVKVEHMGDHYRMYQAEVVGPVACGLVLRIGSWPLSRHDSSQTAETASLAGRKRLHKNCPGELVDLGSNATIIVQDRRDVVRTCPLWQLGRRGRPCLLHIVLGGALSQNPDLRRRNVRADVTDRLSLPTDPSSHRW